MKYIKHEGKYYQELDLDKLSKKELIKLIATCVEVKDKKIFVDRYPWWDRYYPTWYGSVNAVGTTISTNSLSENTLTMNATNMDGVQRTSGLSVVEPTYDDIPRDDLLEIVRGQ